MPAEREPAGRQHTGADDLAGLSATVLADWVRLKRVSPVELTEAVLSRIERLEPRLNAFVWLDAEGARKAARQAEAAVMAGETLGPLHGIPVTVKDVQAVRGMPTRRGSLLSDPAPATADAPAVARLRAAGAVILGKTTTTEQGWTAVSDNPLTGPTHNPWAHGLTAGGSSSGAAALAAAGCGPLHLGTDGAGSVRLPAHFCGVIGFKPTFGTVPYVPVPNNGGLSHIGPIVRDIADAERMLAVMSGPHPLDPTTLSHPFQPDRPPAHHSLAGLRIAFSPDLGHARVDPAVAACVATAVQTFSALGATVDQVTPGWGPQGPDIIRALWGAPLLAMLPADDAGQAKLDPAFLACLRASQTATLQQVQAAHGRRLAYAGEIGRWFSDDGWDLLVTPAASVAAFPHGRQRPDHWPSHDWDWLVWAEFSYPFNLSQGPAISVPCGLTPDGLPVGLQIVAARHQDARVLSAARAFLAARPFAFLGA